MVYASLEIEKSLWSNGYQYVCGIDEVGRGSFAGPVVVGAVIFSRGVVLPEGLADSKLLKPRQRERLAKAIKDRAVNWAVAEVGVAAINKVGIGKATQMAFRKVLRLLNTGADFVLIDSFYIKHLSRKNQRPVKDGDKLCASIAAASILAKVYRDKLMRKLHHRYPQYGMGQHKGYGTKKHQEAIRLHGLSRIHRTSFDLSRFLTI